MIEQARCANGGEGSAAPGQVVMRGGAGDAAAGGRAVPEGSGLTRWAGPAVPAEEAVTAVVSVPATLREEDSSGSAARECGHSAARSISLDDEERQSANSSWV